MTYERWQDLVNKVKTQFAVLGEGKEPLGDMPGEREFVEFEAPMGKMKLELVRRPVVLDKKTIYSKRIGSGTAVEYVYDEKEQTLTFHAFKWSPQSEEWQEVKAETFASL
ncbi:TPA: hypothetical protein DIC39_03985 [Patescibacteria group bacterium]|nr:hypothetical protein [Patescibacteria group bacterium]